jgi:hypothetical protein
MRRAMAALRDPQVLVTLVATVDAADGALFSASFKAMEISFGFSPTRLGVLQMWQSLSFSLSLPAWGMFLPAKGARYLLCLSCFLWAVSTLMTPHIPNFEMQASGGRAEGRTACVGLSAKPPPPAPPLRPWPLLRSSHVGAEKNWLI